MKILLVDDDPFVGEMMAMVLQSCDYEVETAENGVEALAKFDALGDIALVISDMNMPRMGGLELFGQIRKRERDVPFILLTGDEAAEGVADKGVDLYLVKDENIQETLAGSVEKLLKGKGTR